MGKQLNLVHVQQSGTIMQFYNKVDGMAIVMIELSPRATYTENTSYVFRVAEAVEEFIEELVDRSIAVNAAHRILTMVTVMNVSAIHKTVHLVKGGRIMARIQEYNRADSLNNLSLENKIGAAVEDYLRSIGKRLKNTKNTNYTSGTNPRKKDYGAFQPRRR